MRKLNTLPELSAAMQKPAPEHDSDVIEEPLVIAVGRDQTVPDQINTSPALSPATQNAAAAHETAVS